MPLDGGVVVQPAFKGNSVVILFFHQLLICKTELDSGPFAIKVCLQLIFFT